MVVPTHLSRLLENHVELDIRGIDRIYLNAYQPLLQIEGSVANFFLKHRGQSFASSALEKVAALLGRSSKEYGPGSMTYDLRRLRLHGLIERLEKNLTHS